MMDNNMTFEEQDVMEETPKGKRRLVLLVVGGVLLAGILVAAAFVGGQMLGGKKNVVMGSGGPNMIGFNGPGGATRQLALDIKPAPELPQTQPDVRGLYQSRSDNTLKVGTGNIEMMMQKGQDGQMQSSAKFDGPVLEVVVTGDTEIYHDVTQSLLAGPDVVPADDDGTVHVQQVVEQVDSLDDIGKDAHITVWGEKSGDRIIAHTLVYRNFGN
jgi:hypothetical protein